MSKSKNIDNSKKYKTNDKSSKIDKEKFLNDIDSIKPKSNNKVKELGAPLKKLLDKEIEEYKKREKTRAAEMFSIFSSHNFYANGFTPVELRTTLEDLGPTYVKIGQIMSSRVDLLPEEYCKELEKLRQNVKELDPKIARAVIEEETGKSIDELYSEFRDKPLGSASIGQAHYAVLKDGTKVVTKVQRPLIADMMREDFVLLKKLAGLVNGVATDGESQMIDLVSVIEELEKVSEEELNFLVEANNTKFFKEHCITDEEVISCPDVIDELTTERIFTMTYIDGYTVSHKDRIIEDGYDPIAIGDAVANSFVHQVLDVGTFHADPHQGNIMISNGKPYWIDFGMIGHVTDKDIDVIQNMVIAMLAGKAEDLVDSISALGASSANTNRDKLLEDAQIFLNKYSSVKGISDVDMSTIFTEVTDLASKHHISLPGQFTMLGRAILSIEGVIEQLCPDLDLFKILSDKMIERTKKNFNLEKTLIDAGKDVLEIGKKTTEIPGAIADALNSFAKGKAKINLELNGIDEPLTNIGVYIKYVVLAFIACIVFIGSCILATIDLEPKTANGIPVIAMAGIIFSIALAIYSIKKLSKNE